MEVNMEQTVAAVFDKETHAQSARSDLIAAGFSANEMHINASQQTETSGANVATGSDTASEHESMGGKISHFFHNLFGGEDSDDAAIYSEAVNRGSYVLTVTARDDDQLTRATDILNRHNPIDVEERSSQWRSSGWAPGAAATNVDSGTDTRLATEGATAKDTTARAQTTGTNVESQAIPIVEEQLQVGKRVVQHGGVRVHQRVTEKPVQESVRLRKERVTVERHLVDQPVSPAEMAALKEGTIEVRETVEEPVVAKTARVVEEVVVTKEVGERTEQINDTVRRTDVQVEQLGTQDDTAFRSHWQTSYGQTGGRYEDYAPAYQYGSTLSSDERYRGRRWEEVEPQVHAEWEAQHAGTPWEKAKDAVRTGWEKVAK
jgi:uncharacterized protein (TIGR02271 family)